MPKPINPKYLRALFDREPADAVEYLESKGLRVTWNWGEMLDAAHARSFTVAKAAQMDILKTIRDGVVDAAKQGTTLRDFRRQLEPELKKKGWWGKVISVDENGIEEEVLLGSPHRLGTIYRTNLQSAYEAGRFKAQQAASGFPYLQYIAIMDQVTRPTHGAMNGRVFAKSDPIWDSLTPPNGFNCRCRTRAMTARQVERQGITPETSEGRIVTREATAGKDSETGEIIKTTQTGIQVTGPDGEEVTMWTDPGFNTSPAAGHQMDALLAQKASAAIGDEAAFELVAQAINSPLRENAYQSFIDAALVATAIQGQTVTVAIAPHGVARAIVDAGDTIQPIVHVSDRQLIGNQSLTPDQWRRLPADAREADWYRDRDSGRLIAITPAGVQITIDTAGAIIAAEIADEISDRWEAMQ